MSLTTRDIFGVPRGRCSECEDCKEYVVEASCQPPQLKCQYCNHSPGSHNKLCSLAAAPPSGEHGLEGSPSQGEMSFPVFSTSLGQQAVQNSPECLLSSPSSASGAHCGNVEVVSDSIQGGSETIPINTPSAPSHQSDCAGTVPEYPIAAVSTVAKDKLSCTWPLDRLPRFLEVVQPLLNGVAMSEAEHKRLSRQLRDEVTMFLDSNSLIQSGSKGQRRWDYKRLGDALSAKYPFLQWENPPEGTRSYGKRSQVDCVFLKRLTTARKVRMYRGKKAASSSSPRDEQTTPVTKECAMTELATLASFPNGVSLNIARMTVLLEVTISERRLSHEDPLSWYFLNEDVLTVEAELRFSRTMPVIERAFQDVAKEISRIQGKELSFGDIEHLLHPMGMEYFLINQGAVPENIDLPVPHVYYTSGHKMIYGGTPQEVIPIHPTCSLEKLLALCLAIYYIKNLKYPLAFAQTLVLLQKIVVPQGSVPRGLMNGTLKDILSKLKAANKL